MDVSDFQTFANEFIKQLNSTGSVFEAAYKVVCDNPNLNTNIFPHQFVKDIAPYCNTTPDLKTLTTWRINWNWFQTARTRSNLTRYRIHYTLGKLKLFYGYTFLDYDYSTDHLKGVQSFDDWSPWMFALKQKQPTPITIKFQSPGVSLDVPIVDYHEDFETKRGWIELLFHHPLVPEQTDFIFDSLPTWPYCIACRYDFSPQEQNLIDRLSTRKCISLRLDSASATITYDRPASIDECRV